MTETPIFISQSPTLVGLLQARGRHRPPAGYTFLSGDDGRETAMDYVALEGRARAIAASLQGLRLTKKRALLLYPPGLDFIAALFGCWYAGVVAIPAYPPRANRHQDGLQAILTDGQPGVVLTVASLAAQWDSHAGYGAEFQRIPRFATDQIPLTEGESWHDPGAKASDVALLQYTSGSTSQPKGVMLTHENILHNQEMIKTAFEHTQESVVVGWLPVYHDMGLIGNLLQPLYVGCRCILMAPMYFLQQPIRWLRAVSDYRATTSGGPNFAYELCLRDIKPAQREGLDLSHWRVAFVGAEPVRASTLARFSEMHRPYGFQQEAFYPCYGLAETALIVTGGKRADPPVLYAVDSEALKENRVQVAGEHGKTTLLVGCGKRLLDQEVVIVDPVIGAPCLENQIGEIWVRGKSVALGYWNHPEQTREFFGATLRDRDEEPFLRTGDLGFLKKGELFLTGRAKDLIIIRGQNHYPQDIEVTVVQSHPGLRAEGCAVFSIAVDGDERLVVVAEVADRRRSEFSELKDTITLAVMQRHELKVHSIQFLRPYALPKTSSGKIQRQACKLAFLASTFQTVG